MPATQSFAIILHPQKAAEIADEQRRHRAEEAVRYDDESWATGIQPHAAHSPFRFFLQDLLKKHAEEAVTNAGHAHWFSFPIQEALADGLWVIMLKTAQKIGLSLDTKMHVLKDIAPRINRMVNAGMILEYGDGHAAAEAFEKDVVAPIMRNMASMPVGQVDLLQHVVQLQVAQFFANLIRAATAYRKHLQVAIEMLHAGDWHPSGLRVLYETSTQTAEEYVCRLRLEDRDAKWEPVWEQVTNELESIKSRIQLQRAFARMPAKQTAFQVRLQAEGARHLSVEVDWLNTELLLAAANLPNRDFIDVVEDYRRCVKAIRRISADTLVKRFFKRLQASHVNLSGPGATMIEEEVRDRIESLRSLHPRFAVVSPPNIMYRLDLKDPRLDSHIALDLAIHHERYTLDDEKAPPDEIAGRRLAAKIRWGELKTEQIRDMAQNSLVPSDEIARGITLMPHEERRRSAKCLMDSFEKKVDVKTLAVLTQTGLVKITPIFIHNNLSRLPRSVLAEALPDVIRRSRDKDDPYAQRQDLERLILRMVNRLSAKQAREVLDSPALRQPMVTIMEEAYWDDAGRSKHRISHKMFKRFLDRVGDDLWRRYVLSVELSLRRSTYQATAQEVIKDDLFLPQWSDLEDDKEHWFRPSELMGLNPDQVRTLIRAKYTEDEIFLWLHADHDTPRKLMAAYHRDRKRYFEMLKGIPASQRTKF